MYVSYFMPDLSLEYDSWEKKTRAAVLTRQSRYLYICLDANLEKGNCLY